MQMKCSEIFWERSTVLYDLTVGCHTLKRMGFKVDFEDDIMTWDDRGVSMRPFSSYSAINEATQLEMLLYNHLEATLEEDTFASADTEILPSNQNIAYVDKRDCKETQN